MTTARALFHQCRKARIVLAADGEDITFTAPAGVVVPVREIRHMKAELLAILKGDYIVAAAALVRSVSDEEHRKRLVSRFDDRVATDTRNGCIRRGEAYRRAYIELAQSMEANDDDDDGPDKVVGEDFTCR